MNALHVPVDLPEQGELLIVGLLLQMFPGGLLLMEHIHDDPLDVLEDLYGGADLVHVAEHGGVLVVHLESDDVVGIVAEVDHLLAVLKLGHALFKLLLSEKEKGVR